MYGFNDARYYIGFILIICYILVFADDEPGFGLVVIGYWLFSFAWACFIEFRKPKEERSYTAIVGLVGFMLGMALSLVAGSGLGFSVFGGVFGVIASLALWGIIVYNLKDKYPYLTPKLTQEGSDEGDNPEEDDLYEDVG